MKSAVHKKLYTSHLFYFDDWSWPGSRLESQIPVVVSISVNTLSPPNAECSLREGTLYWRIGR